MDYHRQRVEILIDRNSKVYRKLEKRAERDGVSVEAVIDMLLTLGIEEILEDQIDMRNSVERRTGK